MLGGGTVGVGIPTVQKSQGCATAAALLVLALAACPSVDAFSSARATPCRGTGWQGTAAGVCMSAAAKMSKRVAVVGAGASGLATAKEMRARGHQVVVIDQADEVGGVWAYVDDVEDDPMAKSSKRQVHSSMYKSLRTNLPREVMSFSDLPFGPEFSELRYPSHTAVQDYLMAYADHHTLRPLLSLGRRVTDVQPEAGGGWKLTHCSAGSGDGCTTETFDAVAVCNGHYSAAYVPDIPGMEHFKGTSSHSHNYREPSSFAGKKVVIVGASNSGEDIAQEVSTVADTVVMCASYYLRPEWGNPGSAATGPRRNIFRWPRISRVVDTGDIELQDGGGLVEGADHIIFCTGYRYSFPFLEPGREVTVDDNMITPLYMHMFPASHQDMAFIGLPAKIVPFPQFELQGRLAAMVWSGELSLPPEAEMVEQVEGEIRAKARAGVPQKYFHVQGGGQFAYNDNLSKLTGSEPLPLWRRLMYEASGMAKRERPWDYRDAPLGTKESFEEMASAMSPSGRR